MVLNNEIIDNDKQYSYTLSMYIWNFSIIEEFCNKYGIKIIETCKLFDLLYNNVDEYPKISVICKKTTV